MSTKNNDGFGEGINAFFSSKWFCQISRLFILCTERFWCGKITSTKPVASVQKMVFLKGLGDGANALCHSQKLQSISLGIPF